MYLNKELMNIIDILFKNAQIVLFYMSAKGKFCNYSTKN